MAKSVSRKNTPKNKNKKTRRIHKSNKSLFCSSCGHIHSKNRSCKGGFLKGGKYLASSSVTNPHLAYTGKGGNCSAAYPAKSPEIIPVSFINPSAQKGGDCGCGLVGGSRGGCGCGLTGGAPSMTYPNGLIGQPTNAGVLNTLPGVDGTRTNHNYYELNQYKVDPQTTMLNTSAPASFMLGGKKMKHSWKKTKKSRKMRGGTFLPNDLVNFGRSAFYNLGSTYNALNGVQAPVNPLPYRDQLVNYK